VTANGPVDLMENIPLEAADIESLMKAWENETGRAAIPGYKAGKLALAAVLRQCHRAWERSIQALWFEEALNTGTEEGDKATRFISSPRVTSGGLLPVAPDKLVGFCIKQTIIPDWGIRKVDLGWLLIL
jgi:hypothetical protein